MQNKSLDDCLKEANELVPRLSFEETIDFIKNKETVIIDVREESEVINYGLIKEAIHIPRGLIEFKLSPNSPNNPVEIKENTLSIKSIKKDDNDNVEILHRGISKRYFERHFTIADDVKVNGAELKNGLLTIALERVVPEHKKSRVIKIK